MLWGVDGGIWVPIMEISYFCSRVYAIRHGRGFSGVRGKNLEVGT